MHGNGTILKKPFIKVNQNKIYIHLMAFKNRLFFFLELINLITYDNSNKSIFDCLKNKHRILSV